MCKETDEGPQTKEEKPKVPLGLPEPGKPIVIPKDSLVPPIHETKLTRAPQTISKEDVFVDKDLSSITEG